MRPARENEVEARRFGSRCLMAAPSSIAEPARKHKSLARNNKTWTRYSVEMLRRRRQEILRSDAPPGLLSFYRRRIPQVGCEFSCFPSTPEVHTPPTFNFSRWRERDMTTSELSAHTEQAMA